jgi:uncharacterized membrane-anchored protein YitT (DUF2179 family)
MKRLLSELLNAGLIALGILSAGMGLKGFLLSSNFIDGGVTGVSLLLAKTTGLSLSALLPLVNLPFVAVGYHQMGRAFAARSALAAAKTLDFVLYGIDEYTAITVVSEMNGTIRERIMQDLGRGVTVYKGYGGMSGAEQEILYCVVTRLEVGKVRTIVRSLDPGAFIVFHPLAGAEGGVVKTRGFH